MNFPLDDFEISAAFGTCELSSLPFGLPLRKSMRDRLFDAAEKVAGYTNFRWHF